MTQFFERPYLDLLRRFEAHGIRLATPMHVIVSNDGRGPALPPLDEMEANKISRAAVATELESPSDPPSLSS